MKNILLTLSLIFYINCNSTKMEKIIIKPIDQEFNDKLQYKIQYFEISNFEEETDQELLKNLSMFTLSQITSKKPIDKDVTMFFYEKKLLVNYDDYIHQAAEENEFGGIPKFNSSLVAKVWFRKNSDNKLVQTIILYNDGKKTVSEEKILSINSD